MEQEQARMPTFLLLWSELMCGICESRQDIFLLLMPAIPTSLLLLLRLGLYRLPILLLLPLLPLLPLSALLLLLLFFLFFFFFFSSSCSSSSSSSTSSSSSSSSHGVKVAVIRAFWEAGVAIT